MLLLWMKLQDINFQFIYEISLFMTNNIQKIKDKTYESLVYKRKLLLEVYVLVHISHLSTEGP